MENQNKESDSGQQTINIQIPSAENISSRRSLIPVFFAAVILLFFFNFFTVSCGGQKVGSVTGINLVTGTELNGSDMFSDSETRGEKVPPNAWAIIAFVSAIVGLVVFLIKEKREALIGTGAGAFGFASLLILQFAIKSAIERKTDGALQTDFQFAYWAALIAMGIAGFISYLRMKKTHKIVVSTSPPSSPTTSSTDNITPPLASSNPIEPINNLDIGEWFIKNKKIVIGVVGAAIILFGVYYFFIKHDPVRDAKNVASAYCNCSNKYNDALINANQEFITSFDTYGFKKRQEARNKLQELQNSAESDYSICNSSAQLKYTEKRNRYIANKELLEKFDFAYNAQSGSCNLSNQSKLSSLNIEIQNKITTIKDPLPDIEKIKTDLIGKQIPGWRFAYLNEYQSADIINTTQGNDRVEYQIKFQLIDNTSNSQHDCEVMVVYLQGDQGWYLDNLIMEYITYTNTAPLNSWNKITPLKNCRYSIFDQGHNYWAQDGYWGKKYKGGPSEPSFNLTSSEIYIMSRESQPVEILFKYYPKN
jgi:hypothetical protein